MAGRQYIGLTTEKGLAVGEWTGTVVRDEIYTVDPTPTAKQLVDDPSSYGRFTIEVAEHLREHGILERHKEGA